MWRKQAGAHKPPHGGGFSGADKYARRRLRRRTAAFAGLAISVALLAGELVIMCWPSAIQQAQLAVFGASVTAPDGRVQRAGAQATPTATAQLEPTATTPPTPIPLQRKAPEATPAGVHAVPTATPPTADSIPPVAGAIVPGDWPSYLSTQGTGYNSDETTITPSSAQGLKLLWTQQGSSVISAQPTVANGTVFWGDWYGTMHATSRTGTPLWTTNLGRTWPNVPDPCGFSYNPNPGITSTASAANINGQFMVFVGGGDGQLYALNAISGTILWHTRLGAYDAGFIWGSPSVYNGSVYVSLASFSDCPLVQGQIVRLNAATGAVQNVFKVVPDGCTGGTVFGSPTVDPVGGFVYFGSGGRGSCGQPEPYASSVIKLRASNLSLVSYWQVPANQQAEDGDFGNTPTLFWASSDGVNRLMIGIMHKNGLYYAFDRDRLSNGPVWEASVSYPVSEGIYTPSAFDGSHIYITGSGTFIRSTYCGTNSIRALDPANGALVWGRCLTQGITYGAVSATPGIIVIGSGASTVVLASDNGATLYEYHDPAGGQLYGAASISHGVIYQGNREGVLYAFGL